MRRAEQPKDKGSPFRLGPWRVEPQRNRIEGPDGQRTLERKSMELLLLLAQSAPDTVTRDAIVDGVWDGRVVTDDAINKQVSKLRAALSAPSAKHSLIETVPKVGLRLTLVPEPVVDTRRRQFAIAALCGIALMLGAVIALSVREEPIELVETPLTTSPGTEFDPAISANGRWLAYASRVEGGDSAIFITPVGEERPTRVSPPDLDGRSPAWSQNGELAFVGRRGDECRIFVRAPTGRVRPVATCVAADVGGISWLGSALVVADRPGLGRSFELAIDDLRGTRRRLAAPPTGDLGDSHPVVSRDRKSLFFLRSPTVGSSELFALSLESGMLRRLSARNDKVGAFALGPGDSLIISAQRANEPYALWKFDLDSSDWTRLLPGPAQDLAGSGDGRLFAYSRVDRQTVLWQLPLFGAGIGAALTPSTRSDWSPALSPDGKMLAFLSNRSGSEQIWLLDLKTQALRKLTRFGGPGIQDLAWSPNSKILLTSVPTDGQFDIALIDVASGKVRIVARTPADERHGTFGSGQDSILFVRRSGQRFDLRRYDFASQRDEALGATAMRIVSSARSSEIVLTRPFLDGTWVLRSGRLQRISPFPDISRMRDVVVTGGTAWTIDDRASEKRLVAVDLNTGNHRTIRTLPDMARPSGLAVTRDSVIYARLLRLDADLVGLRIKD